MTKKANIIITVVIVFLLYVAGQSLYLYLGKSRSYDRLEQNGILANDTIQYYKAKDGNTVAKIYSLEYTISEIKAGIVDSVLDKVKNMKISVNSVQAVSQSSITNEKHFTTLVRDTTIYDTIKAQYFRYKDKFYSVYGLKIGDKENVTLNHHDNIMQVVYKGDRITKKGKKMPSWWFFTKRKLTQAMYCEDSTSKITYMRYINIVKK